ncbi:MAG: hypothetical protein GY710_24030 [Desulfobacteraceae bacterium]|nr:hypothetical protein [Desulfobacteraceae bacterium]
MKQKIRFEKNFKDDILTVLEFSEVDPGVVMLLHEEEYSLAELTLASKEGVDAFLPLFRRRSFFPAMDMAVKLFEGSVAFFKNKAEEKLVIEYNDIEAFPGEDEFRLDDDVELDALLDEDGDSKEDEMREIDSEDDTPVFTPEDTSEHEN